MRACDVVLAVEGGEVRGWVRGGVVCLEVGGGGGERAADDLFDGARVDVDAAAESGHFELGGGD